MSAVFAAPVAAPAPVGAGGAAMPRGCPLTAAAAPLGYWDTPVTNADQMIRQSSERPAVLAEADSLAPR